jgi:hypothetical protein
MTARIETALKHVHTREPKILYVDFQREAVFWHGTYHKILHKGKEL